MPLTGSKSKSRGTALKQSLLSHNHYFCPQWPPESTKKRKRKVICSCFKAAIRNLHFFLILKIDSGEKKKAVRTATPLGQTTCKTAVEPKMC